jgi:hypothetical protein
MVEHANEPSARIELDPALREHAPIFANLLEFMHMISASFTRWLSGRMANSVTSFFRCIGPNPTGILCLSGSMAD